MPGPRQLNILGMHRSGTSLTAQWLHQMGLFLGTRLLGSGIGNDEGHFEDMDFIDVHNYAIFAGQRSKQQLDAKRMKKFRKLATQKSTLDQWGWKDPRTCLFVDVWDELLPGHKQLIVYREYPQVVDSLVRRTAKVRQSGPQDQTLRDRVARWLGRRPTPKEETPSDFLRRWILHNQRIVDNLPSRDPDSYLLLGLDKFTEYQQPLFQHFTKEWGFDLTFSDYREVYNPKSIARDVPKHDWDAELEEEAKQLTQELERLETATLSRLTVAAP